ncbi:hypothetical protein FC093_08275 [Ilyomonas limi]|uniref:Bacterial EndoU nuclease domain-containing protein n=1 Tax=Ilyomonas limi TaxID=2575867 RepID=A0A4V5UWL8_9BACT|nr:hypothetical protein FC093_08275 [Ilyomonas limi]
MIAKKNSRNNAWIEKEKPSTFFPKDWSKSQLLLEITEAYENKQMITPAKAIGITFNSIKVVFSIKGAKVFLVYPEYEETKLYT